uniref:Uncharacterized protein n=1 Tax=Daphnia magna TaxID=35525 RepID=A0A0P6ASY0_9CRUS
MDFVFMWDLVKVHDFDSEFNDNNDTQVRFNPRLLVFLINVENGAVVLARQHHVEAILFLNALKYRKLCVIRFKIQQASQKLILFSCGTSTFRVITITKVFTL